MCWLKYVPFDRAAPKASATDGDGNLSRAEAAALPELGAVFDQADADGDGVLTPQEYQEYAAAQGAGSQPPQDDGF